MDPNLWRWRREMKYGAMLLFFGFVSIPLVGLPARTTIGTIGHTTGTVIIPAIGIMDTTTGTGDMSITTDIIGS
jgi:hypothetical protein